MQRVGEARRGAALLVAALVVAALLPGSGATPAASPLASREVVGELQVLFADDFAGGRSRKIHLIRDELTGASVLLQLERTPRRALRSGIRVRAVGRPADGGLIVEDPDADVRYLEMPVAAATSERRAVVLVADFAGATVSCSASAVADLMFSGSRSVDGLYQEMSFGQVAFVPDTDDDGAADVFRVTVPDPLGSSCDAYGWAQAADEAADGAGIDLSLYQHRVYVLPSNIPCGWAGLANVGCFGTCRSWIGTCNLPDVYAHELGHNLGMSHASTDDDGDDTVDCEYCDRSDIMGIGGVGWRQVNGPHKIEMGWLPPGQIIEVSGDGRFAITLAALELDPATAARPQVLRLSRPGDAPDYYLSFRIRTGYDADLRSTYVDRTSVHVFPAEGASNTLFRAAIADGETFQDAAADISVTQMFRDGDTVTLQVDVGCTDNPQCVDGTPPATVLNLRRTDILLVLP